MQRLMMGVLVAALAAAAWSGLVRGQEAGGYTAEQVAQAIQVGLDDDVDRLMHSCTASPGGFWNTLGEALEHGAVRRYRITGAPPLARVADHARLMARSYRPVPEHGDDTVVGMLADDVFTVWVEPDPDGEASMVAAALLAETGIEHVVIRPRGDREGRHTVQPLAVEAGGASSAQNLFGAEVEMVGAVATFDRADVVRIARQADVEVVAIATAGEFKCNLDDTRILRGYGEP